MLPDAVTPSVCTPPCWYTYYKKLTQTWMMLPGQGYQGHKSYQSKERVRKKLKRKRPTTVYIDPEKVEKGGGIGGGGGKNHLMCYALFWTFFPLLKGRGCCWWFGLVVGDVVGGGASACGHTTSQTGFTKRNCLPPFVASIPCISIKQRSG